VRDGSCGACACTPNIRSQLYVRVVEQSVRVVEQSIMWRETETSKVFTYQGLMTCTELDKSWTVMSSIYNHLRQGRDKSTS